MSQLETALEISTRSRMSPILTLKESISPVIRQIESSISIVKRDKSKLNLFSLSWHLFAIALDVC